MKVNIWVAVIVLLIGLWDLYTAYNRYQKHKVATEEIQSDSINRTKKLLTGIPSGSKADIISFTILGVVFPITGIVLFFMI